MGPAEFGLLIGEEGEGGGPGASNPLLGDEWVSESTETASDNVRYLMRSRELEPLSEKCGATALWALVPRSNNLLAMVVLCAAGIID